MSSIPDSQYAVQLVGPGRVILNKAKPVHRPGPHQLLARIECVGLCFSDLKLLKQFHQHPRKGPVVSGLSPEVLARIPSYVPADGPTVPGHEVTCRIVAAGPEVKHHRVGQRVIVQADWRDLRTAGSNAAFGYNFEGALQEYVLLDERVVVDRTGEHFLIPVPEHISASAAALVEPWACVENSYADPQRRTIKAGGKVLMVSGGAAPRFDALGLPTAAEGGPADVLAATAASAAGMPDETFDDILYFGADASVIETLNDKLAPRGILNIILAGRRIGRNVSVGVGRVHYGGTRWIGTVSSDGAESYRHIPATGELRPDTRVAIVGAAGPMGQMHVIRAICSAVGRLQLVCADVDDARLEALRAKADPPARDRNVSVVTVNTLREPLAAGFDYFVLMAPLAELVADAIGGSRERCLINIFAGIPAPTRHPLDLDTYIARRCYMFGTSGSLIRDMKIVLDRIQARQLDTDRSVDAVCGMAGAVDGLEAVEHRTLTGKIMVYPRLHDMGLVPLSRLPAQFPAVAAKLTGGTWSKAAEDELLRMAGEP